MILANLEESRPVHGNRERCKIATILRDLDPDDQQILKDAIASPSWNTNALVMALGQRGIKLSYGTLRRHEQKLCNCETAQYA